jgi:hypothetical protein
MGKMSWGITTSLSRSTCLFSHIVLGVYRMKHLSLIWAIALSFASTASPIQAHGGGCLKVYLPAQCCHMDNKKGYQHCH